MPYDVVMVLVATQLPSLQHSGSDVAYVIMMIIMKVVTLESLGIGYALSGLRVITIQTSFNVTSTRMPITPVFL